MIALQSLEAAVGSITIRNIDDAVKQGARLEGVRNGRSMEAEIRALLERTYRPAHDERTARILAMSPAEFIDHLINTANGVGLDIPEDAADPEQALFGAD